MSGDDLARAIERKNRLRWAMRCRCWAGLLLLTACKQALAPIEEPEPRRPQINGAALVLNVNPANRPKLEGAYDFELLGQGTGKACAKRTDTVLYWVGLDGLERVAADRLTQQAIAAAAIDAIARLDDSDTFVLTSVVTEAKGSDQICASVRGRGVRLIKAAVTP